MLSPGRPLFWVCGAMNQVTKQILLPLSFQELAALHARRSSNSQEASSFWCEKGCSPHYVTSLVKDNC